MNRSNRITRLSLVCFALGASAAAAAQPGKISAALEALQSVHSLVEVALSPDGSTVIYGDTVKGKRGDAEVDAPYFGASVYDDPEIYARSSPLSFIKNVHTPTLLIGGDRDAEVPITQSYEYWNALRRLGVETQFVVYPDEGHFFFRREDQVDVATRLIDWFNGHLRPVGLL